VSGHETTIHDILRNTLANLERPVESNFHKQYLLAIPIRHIQDANASKMQTRSTEQYQCRKSSEINALDAMCSFGPCKVPAHLRLYLNGDNPSDPSQQTVDVTGNRTTSLHRGSL
jgi:hypothetical protein